MGISLRLAGGSCATERDNGFKIIRYDRIVEDYVTTRNVATWQRLNTDFPRETQALVESVLRLGPIDAEGIEDSLCAYYERPEMSRLRADVAKRFETLREVERPLGQAFARLQKDIPGFTTPRVYAQISCLHESLVVGDSLIGISLDKYLGADYPAYRHCFYANQRVTMEPDRIAQDCLIFYLNLLSRKQMPPRRSMTLLECMVHQGKLNWIAAHALRKPLISVAAVMPATKAWYQAHEHQVWQTLQQRHLLSSTDSALIHSVIYSSDAHPYFADTHSRGVGLWVGIRLVDRYMERHPEVTVAALLSETDYQKVAREAQL